MRIEPELSACSIVLLGKFNPAIFSPSWFRLREVISDQDENDAEVGIIHPEVANLRIGVMNIAVETNRFHIETSEAPWIRMADFLTNTFNVLNHTPINRVGINRMVHFTVGSEEKRNAIGRILAPVEPWGEWGKRLAGAPSDRRGGFRTLTMEEPRKEASLLGHIQTTIQPSLQMSTNSGIFVAVNDDYLFEDTKPEDGAGRAVAFLSERFEKSIASSEWIIDQIMAIKP